MTALLPMVDFHTHILPQMDDGSQSVEQTLQMLSFLADQGVKTVVATPHFYAHRDQPDAFLAKNNRKKEGKSILFSNYKRCTCI